MILDEIASVKRLEIARRRARIPLAEFRTRAENAPEARPFAASLDTPDTVALVAEIKPASPTAGTLRENVDPARLAQLYAANGAAAISVLTDRQFFKGDPNNLKAARVGASVPLLRKDFILDEYQVYESRALQADAILLITRLLDDARLRAYRELAEALGMAALVEVHDEDELERALETGAQLVGVNNRDLSTMTVSLAVTERLVPQVPRGVCVVSESGMSRREDVMRAAQAGADAVLVGAALMRAPDVAAQTRELASVPRAVSRPRVR